MGALSALLVLSALSKAGDFSFIPGSWTNVTSTGSTSGSTTSTISNPSSISATLSIKSVASGVYTLKGTWNFTAIWTPATGGENPPANVKITISRSGTPTVGGSGAASITSGTNTLVSVTSTNSILSGITQYLPDVVITLPLVSQPDGTYKAVGSIDSDVVSATYDDQGATQTTCTEAFSISKLEAA